MSQEVRWPNGYAPFYRKVALHADRILSGTLLAIDPASGGTSVPGFAIFYAGELQTSGTVEFPKRKADIYQRLQYLHEKVSKLLPVPPDVFGVEEIHKAIASNQLLWATGVSIAAAAAPATIEVPLNVWKSLAKATPGYIKGDAMDAEMIGRSLVLLAQRK